MITFLIDFTKPLAECSVSWGAYSVSMPYHLMSSLMLDLECTFGPAVCVSDNSKLIYQVNVGV